jgi:F-type H+-transporting ATPase subunit alpha
MLSRSALKEQYSLALAELSEIGYVKKINHPIVYIEGLPGAHVHELVYFENGQLGVVTSLTEEYVEVCIYDHAPVGHGTKVARSGKTLGLHLGKNLLGQVVDPLGASLYENVVINGADEFRVINQEPKGINERERVSTPFETGVTVVDLLVPLGKGQRELIIGDRNTGKTEFVLQTLLNQARAGSICIYAGVGRKMQSIRHVEEFFKENGIADKFVIVATSSSDPIGLINITPDAAMTIAEYFRDLGNDVILVIDDLTAHAKYYRELSLIAKSFPGRDAYPGDVFHVHAKLLERAGNFKIDSNKTSSITCLPIAETVGGDLTGYIQTNLMSMTDGHIFFDVDLFKAGQHPSINHFYSVTRVGRQTQTHVRWGINRELASFLLLQQKTERFVHFGSEVNEGIKTTMQMYSYVSEFLTQSSEQVYSINVQILTFCLIWTSSLTSNIDSFLGQLQYNYVNNGEIRSKVDTLISSCETFNQLLRKVGAENHVYLNFGDKK